MNFKDDRGVVRRSIRPRLVVIDDIREQQRVVTIPLPKFSVPILTTCLKCLECSDRQL